ncbi:MAG TPA: winged helix-turn-helix domain-containing protein [Thermoanaerobaculia bacterium]
MATERRGAKSDGPRQVRFGVFEADLRSGELRKQGIRLRLAGQPFEILAMLIAARGDVVTREELRRRLWADDTHVDFDHSLNAAINKLREALGDSSDAPRFVETLPRRGYRFVAPIEVLDPGADAAAGPPAPEPPPTSPPPAKRASARSLALAAAAGAAALLLLAAVTGWLRRAPQPAPQAAAPIRSVAVLPFSTIGQDPDKDFFADGMTEEVIGRLSGVGALHVISRTSVMLYRDPKQPLPEIAKALGVDAIVEGSIQHFPDQIQISAKLIDARSDRALWAQTWQRDSWDILALQGEIARAIAEGVRVRVTQEDRARLERRAGPLDPEAYQEFARGRHFQIQGIPPSNIQAIQHFRKAIALAPDYAQAWARLAEAEAFGSPSKDWMPRARADAARALELAPDLAEAHAADGLIKMFGDWDFTAAERSFRRALELDPNVSDVHYRFSTLLAALGRFDEAIAACRRAYELDPLSDAVGHHLGRLYYFARDYEKAVAQLEHVVTLDPRSYYGHFFLAIVREEQGDEAAAVAHFERAFLIGGANAPPVSQLHRIWQEKGYEAFQRAILQWNIVKSPPGDQLTSAAVALRLTRLGEKEQALQWLGRAFESRTRDLVFLGADPTWDPLRGDPRFEAYLEKIGLPRRPRPGSAP